MVDELVITSISYKDKQILKAQCIIEGTSMSEYLRPFLTSLIKYVVDNKRLPCLILKHPQD